MRRTSDTDGVLWQKGCFCVVHHGRTAGRVRNQHLDAHRQDTRLHIVFWHTFVWLTTGRTADMSQQRQTPIHTECDTDLHHNAHTHTQDGGRDTPAQYTTGARRENIQNTHTHYTHHTQKHIATYHHCTATTRHTRTRTHARTGNGNGVAVVKSGNIKVDLRSGAALSQERTRTHIRARNRIL